MELIRFCLNRLKVISFKSALIAVLPLWGLTGYFVYYSYYRVINDPYNYIPSSLDKVFRLEHLHIYLHSEYLRMKNVLTAKEDRKTNLLEFGLFFDTAKLARLFKNLPDSGKNQYIKGRLVLNGEMYPIKAKLRGNSYWHWNFDHKSWRIEILDNRKVLGMKKFDLVNPKFAFATNDAIAFQLAKDIGLWDVENRPVKVYLNNKYSGHSFTLSRIDENFLYKNKKTAGSVYGIDLGVPFVMHPNFFNSSIAWSVGRDWLDFVGVEHDKNRKLELDEFARAQRAIRKVEFDHFLQNYFDLDSTYKLMALDAILGIYHRSHITSHRFYFDNKEGRFYSVPWDFMNWVHGEQIMLSRNPIYDRLRSEPRTNFEFLKYVWRFKNGPLKKDKILKMVKNACEELRPAVFADPHKDALWVHHVVRARYTQIFPYTNEYFGSVCRFYINLVENRMNYIDRALSMPKVEGYIDQKKDHARITLEFNADISPIFKGLFYINSNVQLDVYIDSNNNGKFDENDSLMNNDYPLYSINRSQAHNSKVDIKDFEIFAGKFNLDFWPVKYLFFVKKRNLKNIQAVLKHPYDNQEVNISFRHKDTSTVTLNYHYPKKLKNINKLIHLGPGIIKYDKDQIFEDEVKVLPGTKFFLGPGVNLVFKRKVTMLGKKDNPIEILREESDYAFGTVFLSGRETKNSVLKYVKIIGGDRAYIGLSDIVGSLSIYNTSDVTIKNLVLKTDCESCQGLTLYKSKNINLQSLKISGVKRGLLNIELSEVTMDNVDLDFSLGYGLRALFSRVTIENSIITRAFETNIFLRESDVFGQNNLLKSASLGIKKIGKSSFTGFEFEDVLKKVHDED